MSFVYDWVSKTPSPLHNAVRLINIDAVMKLVQNGAPCDSHDVGGQTPLHLCVENELEDILKILIRKCPDAQDRERRTVLRAAVDTEWLAGVRVVLDAGADVTIEAPDGKTPLHSAILNGSKDIIKLLLKKEPNLLAKASKDIVCFEKCDTIMDMIIHYVPSPTKFIGEIFDSCISLDDSTKSPVKIDYGILMPSTRLEDEMDVIENLLKTGNEYDQRNLLLHPLIESFIYLKWLAVKPYYLQIAGLHAIFVVLLTLFIVKTFYGKDKYGMRFEWYYLMLQGFFIYVCVIWSIIEEFCMNYKSTVKAYFSKWENYIQLIFLLLATILPIASVRLEYQGEVWPRHVASGVLLLAWMQMLIILAQYPRWGYYVVMFERVAFNVIKILGTFFALIIGFALTFMIQFHAQPPFGNPWDAIVKTLFLLTSEFEYNEVFKAESAEKLGSSFQVVRIIFVVFLVLGAIVLMNMMVGVAVDDIKELKSHGDIGRLERQASFIRSLDKLEYYFTKVVRRVSDDEREFNRYCRHSFARVIGIRKDKLKSETNENIREIPKRIVEAFFNIAQKNEEEEIQAREEDTKDVEQRDNYDNTMDRLKKLESTVVKNINVMKEEFALVKQILVRFEHINRGKQNLENVS